MTTLIKLKSKAGCFTRTCGAMCYNAKGKKCRCVCGGLNHGQGLEAALSITNKNRDLILSNGKPGECYIIQLQTKLFLEEWL